VTAKGDMFIWGGNAAQSGQITANSAGGGLYIAASGTNQNIRLVPSGTGIVQSIGNFDVSGTGTFSSSVAAVNEYRLKSSAYPTTYNTTLRSDGSANGILQLGNSSDNFIIGGSTNTGGNLRFRVNANSESITSGIEALYLASTGVATFSSELTSIGAGSLGIGQTTDLLYVGDRTTTNTRYIKFIRASALTDIVQIQGMNGGVGYESIALQAAGSNVLIGQTNDTGEKLQVNGSAKFTGAQSGTPYSFINTQSGANGADLGDGVMSVNYNITGSTGTETVVRAMSFSANNNMTGGTVTNLRGWNVASSTASGSTTTNLDQIYIEKGGTSLGIVDSNRAIRINNMQGTNQAGLAFAAFSGSNNVYALFGTAAIPSGNWGVYQTQSSYNNWFSGKVIIGSTDTVGASPLNVKNLPTSASGLATGDVWNNLGVLNIV
jgi:hypothetical protein